jgi:small multidrug resistance family-3 protein
LAPRPWWLLPGAAALGLFAWLLTLPGLLAAGRAYAAYGGVYVAASLACLWAVEGVRPAGWDAAGVTVCLLGTAIILAGARHAG